MGRAGPGQAGHQIIHENQASTMLLACSGTPAHNHLIVWVAVRIALWKRGGGGGEGRLRRVGGAGVRGREKRGKGGEGRWVGNGDEGGLSQKSGTWKIRMGSRTKEAAP